MHPLNMSCKLVSPRKRLISRNRTPPAGRHRAPELKLIDGMAGVMVSPKLGVATKGLVVATRIAAFQPPAHEDRPNNGFHVTFLETGLPKWHHRDRSQWQITVTPRPLWIRDL